ncbi:hypothetical protein KAFR_0B05610 [Kazachstania africana CBS 2517]|uniref:F-box domain-containing protein n=1 Tax=Kazachstania africana (strain ATCC 22294 / BCRC 22015 / CBS 2517 / CECT 1963 / NBRC 1671 / NRRL Y-8276) TaxID=1071382 RepID=H2AR56_KAZAF|nr:hypothetical protein KAFR_0B05610 [Kazachstania africana CBS 2517]CCF56856.1 hypothetical protein KAFR_0B05610 [Kazachstania africana CBS 2517]
MLSKVPPEIFRRITCLISQEDKVALTYVSKKVYNLTLPSLYENLFLNERYYFPSDLDNSLGTHIWSVLYFPFIEEVDPEAIVPRHVKLANDKFRLLLRSLNEGRERLCHLIKRVHCTWHLNERTMALFIYLLNKYAPNLIVFENFIRNEITMKLLDKASTLETLNISPPNILPKEPADEKYFTKMRNIIQLYNFDNIQDLTIHVNARSFFRNIGTPMRIKSLSLNLRTDTYDSEGLDNLAPYSQIFDIASLEELEILSWYNSDDSDLDLYEMWGLNEFWEFNNIKILSLFSLFANNDFLRGCIKHFECLSRFKIDFMFDTSIDRSVFDLMARSPCADNLEYIDVKFEELSEPLLSIEQDEISKFHVNTNCQCDTCTETVNEIILQKYFPNEESFLIKDFHDVESRNFILQMFKLYPILPYSHFFDLYPSIGYYSKTLESHVDFINELLRKRNDVIGTSSTQLMVSDVIRVYHAYMHSMRKSFDYFLQRFPKLTYLTLNELPTKVIQFDEVQRCNIPIFYTRDYKSNQVYELVNDESLFD